MKVIYVSFILNMSLTAPQDALQNLLRLVCFLYSILYVLLLLSLVVQV